jgi:hypothetical protein
VAVKREGKEGTRVTPEVLATLEMLAGPQLVQEELQ